MGRQPQRVKNPARALLALVGQEAAFGWRVRPVTAAVVFVLPLVGGVAVVLSSIDGPLFDVLTGTASPLDWSRCAAFALAAGLGAASARRLWRVGRARGFLVYAVFGAVCLLIAGEQIAWGATIVGTRSVGETPVRAIGHVPHAGGIAMLVAGAFGAAAPWLMWRRRRGPTSEIVQLTIPPLFLSSGFFLVFAYETITLLLVRHPHAATATFGEWSEAWLAISLMAFALLNHQRLRRSTTPVVPLPCGGLGWPPSPPMG
jgi:hypothetical protein